MKGASPGQDAVRALYEFANVVGWGVMGTGVRWVFPDAVIIVTQPLLTAASCRRLQTRVGAVSAGQRDVVWTQRHAAHHTIHTAALVLTAGLEILSVLIHTTSKLTRTALSLS